MEKLINFDHTVYFPYKPETGHEANSTSEQEEKENHNKRISKV